MYTIFLQDKTIGVVGLSRWDKIHYMIDPDQWSKGFATEALGAFLIALFELQPKRQSTNTWISRDNVASRRVLEKCGFVPSKAGKKAAYMPQSAEISEQEELDMLQNIVVTHPSKGNLFFIYVKPTKDAV
jgi:RimJ/RimL family protein N-acetyltransferase